MAKTGTQRRRKRSKKNEEIVIAALLSKPTIAQAARLASVSRKTVQRWMQDPAFAQRLAEERKRVLDGVVNALVQGSSIAVKELLALAKSRTTPAHARVSACRSILHLAFAGVEDGELDARVDALERRVEVR